MRIEKSRHYSLSCIFLPIGTEDSGHTIAVAYEVNGAHSGVLPDKELRAIKWKGIKKRCSDNRKAGKSVQSNALRRGRLESAPQARSTDTDDRLANKRELSGNFRRFLHLEQIEEVLRQFLQLGSDGGV